MIRVFAALFMAAIAFCGYMTPSILAYYRAATSRRASWVMWVNVLTGWTGIGWLVALGMALKKQEMPDSHARAIRATDELYDDAVFARRMQDRSDDIDTPPAEQHMDLTGDQDFPPPAKDNWL